MKLNYLIVGTGRSGTVFMARLLTSLGVPCGHESVFDWRGIRWAEKKLNGEVLPELSHASTISWKDGKATQEAKWLEDMSAIQADSSYMAVPFLKEKLLENTTVIHVVRDPIKVVHSFCHHIDYFTSHEPKNSYEQFIYRHVPELRIEMPQHDRACLYYIKWNEIIEQSNPMYFHRVEDEIHPIMTLLNKKSDNVFSNKEINTYKKWSNEHFHIHSIQSKEIKESFIEIGRRYKYKMSNILLM